MIRPDATRDVGPRVKLHRRVLRLDGVDHTVLTLRPGTQARFATNYEHETWHVLTDSHGGRLLGRLLWGLAYQRVPNTLVLIDRPFLDPNPFDAEPSDPVVLAPGPLTPLTAQAARQLRRMLPLRGNPDGTVRLQTPGLDKEIAAVRRWREHVSPTARWHYRDPVEPFGTRCARLGGVVLFSAPPVILREWAREVYELADWYHGGQSASEGMWPGGEVQLWGQYHRMVSAARTARRDLLTGPAPELDLPEDAPVSVREAAVPVAQRPPRDVRELVWSVVVDYQKRMIPGQGLGMSK
ncbi:hypothetical protein [Labedaea rhizosphaerae]|uniref:Uncharacterized protein n=1 Tax=Labedaea rhizosphaerae TaxID=598644 RepID=A0A4R6SP91_LABRH|nr:hypothetical protein [Labedaea rhizosphaerae]TDQ05272.1 hypothetical protein EV186_1011241 [Labedaea rhizosphaerae]